MTTGYRGSLRWLVMCLALLVATGVRAQDSSGTWVQIEAQPTRAKAEERARAYAGVFPEVAGFALSSGWYGIALGPFTPEAAAQRLADLRRERLVPSDSFVADGRSFRARFWPNGDAPPAPPSDPAIVVAQPDPATVAARPDPLQLLPPAAPPPEETPAQARAAEADLTRLEREELQSALQWYGFYDAAIDGAFGPGTRAAMAAWQTANAAEPTGVLTTRQRNTLVEGHLAALAEIGLSPVAETEAGIEIDLPLAMVEFDRYEPPFVQYRDKDGSGVRVLLISQPGDTQTLAGLFDILQTLEIVPLGGARSRSDQSFEITGRNGRIESYSYAVLKGGLVKGFTLVWPVSDGTRMARVLEAMKKSFRPVGDLALDPGLAPMTAAQRAGLLSGLEVRRPALSRSGMFIDATGTVLTTPDVLQSCTRLTIDGAQEMTLHLSDAATGLAVLTPLRPLSPPGIAMFQTAPERPGADVAVAGYPFEDALTAPTLTFGRVEALTGLDGEPGLKRLSLPARAGDAGGPVIDGTGAVIGMMLPRAASGTRVLPPDVSFAATGAAIAARLATDGITLIQATPSGALPPEDLTRTATRMTVLVSCWR